MKRMATINNEKEYAVKNCFLALATLLSLASAGVSAMDVEERVASQCTTCHGPKGQAASPIFPSLAGQNREYLAKQLHRRGYNETFILSNEFHNRDM